MVLLILIKSKIAVPKKLNNLVNSLTDSLFKWKLANDKTVGREDAWDACYASKFANRNYMCYCTF